MSDLIISVYVHMFHTAWCKDLELMLITLVVQLSTVFHCAAEIPIFASYSKMTYSCSVMGRGSCFRLISCMEIRWL